MAEKTGQVEGPTLSSVWFSGEIPQHQPELKRIVAWWPPPPTLSICSHAGHHVDTPSLSPLHSSLLLLFYTPPHRLPSVAAPAELHHLSVQTSIMASLPLFAFLLVLTTLLASIAPVHSRSQQPWRHTPSPSSPSLFPSTPSPSLATAVVPSTPVSLSVPPFAPLANPAAIVTAGNARFTLLTDRLIRLEWSATSTFQDAATWVAIQRNHTVPPFKTSSNATHTVITTPYLTVEYLTASPYSFNSSNLRVTITYTTTSPSGARSTNNVTWSTLNHEDRPGNLFGTFRTLDGDSTDESNQLDCAVSGRSDQHCTYGVVSRNGYAVIDDTHAPAFDSSPWPWITPRQWPAPPSAQCALSDSDKKDCGFIGITGTQCQQKGCCWTGGSDDAQPGIPSCFYDSKADQDLYLLGHGHDYKAAIRDFTRLSGSIPLPPRYTFGVFFSRYWAYARSHLPSHLHLHHLFIYSPSYTVSDASSSDCVYSAMRRSRSCETTPSTTFPLTSSSLTWSVQHKHTNTQRVERSCTLTPLSHPSPLSPFPVCRTGTSLTTSWPVKVGVIRLVSRLAGLASPSTPTSSPTTQSSFAGVKHSAYATHSTSIQHQAFSLGRSPIPLWLEQWGLTPHQVVTSHSMRRTRSSSPIGSTSP